MRNYLDTKPTRVYAGSPMHPLALGLVLLLVAGLLLVLDRTGVISPLRGRVGQALAPVAGALTSVRDRAAATLEGVGTAPQLSADNNALRQQNSALQATVVALQQAQVENTTLRQQLGIKQQNPWASHMLPAEVIVRSPDAPRRTMMLAVGAEAGLKVGMAVVGQQGSSPPALVGVVEDVAPHTASVLLITDFGSQISGRVLHAGTAATGVVHGQWQQGSRLRLLHVARDATFAVGDSVVTAGLTQQLGVDLPLRAIPAGIPIGLVVAGGAEGTALAAELRPYVDPDQVRSVWVILSPDA